MSNSAAEPLMPNTDGDENNSSYDRDPSIKPLLLEKDLRYPGIYMWLLALSAGISGLLFGYDTGVISSTLVGIHSSLGHPLSILDKSLITSITALFALVISPVSGLLADSYGRKRVIILADVAFILGAFIQAFACSVVTMVVGRAVVGLAIGTGSFVAPLYITELSPSPFRGSLVILYVLFITFGQVVAYFVGFIFVEAHKAATGWRWIVGLGAVPAVLQCLIMFGMPETPRWLVMKMRDKKARVILSNVYGTNANMPGLVDSILEAIKTEMKEEGSLGRGLINNEANNNRTSWLAIYRDTCSELLKVDANRRALIIACLLQGLQQLCGFNSIMYFSATIFTILGFESPALMSLSVASTNFIMTCLALMLIDRIGRRTILLYSIPMMALGLLLCGIGFSYISPLSSTSISGTLKTSNNALTSTSSSRVAPIIVLISIIIFVGSYAIGLGTVPWLQSELFPLSVRALGSGISTSTNWATNFLVGLTFLLMLETLSPTGTFFIYSGICIFGWLAIWRYYPETKGFSLEEMRVLLSTSWH